MIEAVLYFFKKNKITPYLRDKKYLYPIIIKTMNPSANGWIKKLLKEAEYSGFIRGIISRKLIDGYDKSGDEYVDWDEFKTAIDEIADDSK